MASVIQGDEQDNVSQTVNCTGFVFLGDCYPKWIIISLKKKSAELQLWETYLIEQITTPRNNSRQKFTNFHSWQTFQDKHFWKHYITLAFTFQKLKPRPDHLVRTLWNTSEGKETEILHYFEELHILQCLNYLGTLHQASCFTSELLSEYSAVP